MFAPPMIATRLIVSSPPSISASRRSISSPPMIEMALMLPTARNRPPRREPDKIATIQRTGFLARVGAGLSWAASRGRSPVSVASSPRVLAASARLDRSSSSSRVSPAHGGVLAEGPQRLVPFGVGDPEGCVGVGHPARLLHRVHGVGKGC